MSAHTCVVDLAGTCTGPGPCDTSSFGAGDNWVNKVGGLPDYIRAIAHSLQRDHGMSESRAISTAVATVKRWAAGGGGVTAATRGRAAAALAEWEAKKTAAHSLTAAPAATVDLAEAGHVYHWKHGWIPITPHAALQKAHGSHAGAARILHRNGQHDDAHLMLRAGVAHHEALGHVKTAARYRQALASAPGGAQAKIQIRPGFHQGATGHHIVGSDTRGRRVKVFVGGNRSHADKAAENIRAGRSPFDVPKAPDTEAVAAARQAAQQRDTLRRDLTTKYRGQGASYVHQVHGIDPSVMSTPDLNKFRDSLHAEHPSSMLESGRKLQALVDAEHEKRSSAKKTTSAGTGGAKLLRPDVHGDGRTAEYRLPSGHVVSVDQATGRVHNPFTRDASGKDAVDANPHLLEKKSVGTSSTHNDHYVLKGHKPPAAPAAPPAPDHRALVSRLSMEDLRVAQQRGTMTAQQVRDYVKETARIAAKIRESRAANLTAEPAATVDLSWSEQAHPRGGKGTAAGGKFVAKNSAPSTPDGMTGNVRDFQKRMGLPVTGVIDARTAAAIARETAAKTAGGGKGKHKAKHKAKKPRKITAKVAAAHARATQRQAIGQHIATINSLTVAQRTEARRRMPVPPTGYVWGTDNTLRAVKMTRAQQTAPLTGI